MMKFRHRIQAGFTGALCVGITTVAFAAPDDSKQVWSLLTGQLDNQEQTTGIVNYSLDAPETYEMVHEISSGNSLGAGVMVDGVFYWFEYLQQYYGYDSIALYAYDTEDESVSLVKSYGGEKQGVCFSSPTYDYQTKTVYALSGLMGGGDLVSVDLETGEVTNLMSFTGMVKNEEYNSEDSLKAIAINYDGDMYGVSYWGRLYKVNKVSGECTLIADLDFNPEKAIMYDTSLAFDNDTNELYWHVYTWVNLYKEVRKIDIHDGTTTQISIFGDRNLLGDFYIPFTVASAGAPAKVADLTVIPDAEGALGATLTWTNPTRTYGRGGTLESLQRIEIYRNDALVATLDNPGIGEDMTWHDDNVPSSDLYAYKVVPFNEGGQGDRTAVTMFVGQGIPMPVTDLTLTAVGPDALLEWTAPEHGKFDAYLDLESLCYEITRSDGVTVATDCKETTFLDKNVKKLARYTYYVTAKNVGGESVQIFSDAVVCGPAVEIPAVFAFENADEFSLWTAIDGNGDQSTWYYNTWPVKGAKSDYSSIYQYPAHEYFISPKVSMKAGQHYKVTFDALPANKNVTEIIAVSFGPEALPAVQDSVTQYEFRSASAKTLRASLPIVKEDGGYNVGFVHRSVEPQFGLTISNIRVEEDHDGSVEGKVTYMGTPVANAVISTEDGLYTATSDNEGHYLLSYLPAGSHRLLVSALGYDDTEVNAEVTELSTAGYDFELQALPQYVVSGSVIDAVGEPVEGATVFIGGYNSYETVTGSEGEFIIPEVYAHTAYSLVIEKNNLLAYNAVMDIDSDVDCGQITLQDNLKSPYKVSVEDIGTSASVKWQSPLGDPKECRYDDGVFDKSLGLSVGSSMGIFGHVNRTPSVLYGVSFYVMSTVEIQQHYSVQIHVFDLDEYGNPTGNPVYSNTYVPVTDDAWTEYTFPAPIDCPNGYMVGISHWEFVSLAIDGDGDKDRWPFVPYVNCFCSDYTTGDWAYLDQTDFNNNFAFRSVAAPYGNNGRNIRWAKSAAQPLTPAVMPKLYTAPEGYVQGTRTQPMKAVEDRIRYNVYRGVNNPEVEAVEWEELASGLRGNNYEDEQWATLPQGVYRYGVKAVYANDDLSPVATCDSIGKNMITVLKATVTTDTPDNEAEGAVLALFSNDGVFSYSGTFDENGECAIENIWKNSYRVIISKDGFNTIEEFVDMTSDNLYSLSYSMYEDRVAPKNLRAVYETDDSASPLVIWNFPDLISEDFEGHEDFAVNSPGEIGWQYIDGDGGETGGFMGYEWPGIFEPMAFMVFNPYATTPDCTELGIYPYQGQKMLTDFATYETANDDWIISPKLYFEEDFKFNFFASCFLYTNPEVIQVGYSETGCEPEDFIWLDDNKIISNSYWSEFSYDVPKSAKYVTIHCISNQCSILMLDNLRIGLPSAFNQGYYAPKKKPCLDSLYEVYLDDDKVADTNAAEYQFNALPLGKHTVGVRTSYTSGYSPMSVLELEVTEGGVVSIGKVNNNLSGIELKGRTLTVNGDYESISIYTVDGLTLKSNVKEAVYDLSALESGVYVISVKTGTGNRQYKLQLK
ncbi:MAG: hypothetical protein HDS13_00655 [Bacteroides sp.]|nr:hypothetical protein [Bacteroides sp.]